MTFYTTYSFNRIYLSILGICLVAGQALPQESAWSYSSYQITDEHRYEYGAMGPHWGHHLGHMVRTADGELWYVDDTGNNVYQNPAAYIHHFDGDGWDHVATAQNPNTIQQNIATIAVGDTVYIYGMNTANGFVEEAKFDAVSGSVIPYEHILNAGGGTNYIGAAVSPSGIRVVWWTRVVNNDGPSPWYYIYHDAQGWHGPIESWVPGNDFSYNFVSFENDSTFWITGELPGGAAPNWVFKMGAGMVRLGEPLEDVAVYTQDITAHSIWVNPLDGGIHLFGQSHGGTVSYYYHPQGGSWPEEESALPIGTVSRFRTVDSDDGNLYLVYNSSGFKMVPLSKASIIGPLDFTGEEVIDIGRVIGFESTGSVWAETRSYQTNSIPGLTFGFYGNLWENSALLRSLHVIPEPGPALKLLLPNGQETLVGDEQETISWTYNPADGIEEVALEWRSGSASWQSIESRVPNNGYAIWDVPAENGSNYELRIYDADNPLQADTSDRPFNIAWEFIFEGPPIATILSPAEDVTLDINESLIASGEATDPDGYVVRHEWDMGNGEIFSGVSMTSVTYAWDASGYYSLKFRAKDDSGLWGEADSIVVTVGDPSSTRSANTRGLINTLKLKRSWPNPFNPNVNIEMSLPSSQPARIEILDLTGRTVYDTMLSAGTPGRTIVMHWNGLDNQGQTIGSGTYIVRVTQNNLIEIMKVTLLR